MTPQRCFLSPIPNRVTAWVQVALQNGNKSAPFVTIGPMNTTALSMRRPREINPKGGRLQQLARENGYTLPEYLVA